MSLVAEFIALVAQHGSPVIFHRESADAMVACPCRTPEGYRDPEWHDAHPEAPLCNERGFLPGPGGITNLPIKGFVQPIQSTRATRLSTEFTQVMFGTVEADDHLGIFPESWQGTALDFNDWSQSGDEYVRYNGRNFMVVNANLIADPEDGNPRHHWEVGLRLVNEDVSA